MFHNIKKKKATRIANVVLAITLAAVNCISIPMSSTVRAAEITTTVEQYPFPHNTKYANGIMPKSDSQDKMNSDMLKMYTRWKKLYITAEGCAPGELRVLAGDSYSNGTCSEGTGYGLLISVYMANSTNDAHNDFDRILKYYKSHLIPGIGLMEWNIDKDNNGVNPYLAPDGDEDAALALLMADKQWGSNGAINYLAEAKTIIDNLMKNSVNKPQYTMARSQLVNVQNWSFTMSSYQMPAAFSEFYKATGDTQWIQSTKAAYGLFDYFSKLNPSGALPFKFKHDYSPVSVNATTKLPNDYHYGFDSCRVPWRITMDYLWNGTSNNALAHDLPDQQVKWFTNYINTQKGGEYSQTPASFNLDGTAKATYASPRNMVGMMAPAAMVDASNQESLNKMYDYLKDIEITTDSPGDYYQDSLLVLGMMTLTGNMPNFNDVEAHPNNKMPVTVSADTTAPTKPKNVAASSITLNTITLTWTPSTDDSGKVKYTVYQGNYSQYGTSTTTCPLKRLNPGTTYNITVVAEDEAGNKTTSDVLTVTTVADATLPSKPASLAKKSSTTNSIVLKWNASTDNSGLSVNYDVFNGATKISTKPVYFNDDFLVSNLLPSTSYSFRVVAKDISGNTTTSDTLVASTSSVTAAIDSAIASVQTLYTAAVEGTEATNYVVGTKAILQSAITTASAISANALTKTQAEINDAVLALNVAKIIFINSQVTKIELVSAIIDAKATMNAFTEGTIEGQVKIGSKISMSAAIAIAQLACDLTPITPEAITIAVNNLNEAKTTLLASKVVLNKSALIAAISAAQSLHDGASNIEYVVGSKDILKDKIETAQGINNRVGTKTQVNINEAVTTLNSAIDTFNGGRVTLATVVAGITSVVAPVKNATTLTLPTVPEGYAIEIKSATSLPAVISLDGKITLPKKNTTIAMVFTVTKTLDKTSADTASINVIVLAKTREVPKCKGCKHSKHCKLNKKSVNNKEE
ncbi:glycosyl hydrolase family 8 [Clostridium lacusfryxellense]|uniref:glycosyl hydrolase family 8 n=1 Tax=Clostridium lacusfryxellense TaxID=205328 RepID=UPI001C0C301D|nr:glycosyl hydrolase family 8 [Clostridium lacusfryxellense]MBU3113331.1 fibronectin type III domain-containing protein [Clostridium lacusfryxellense]